jgi:Na+/proline symporter
MAIMSTYSSELISVSSISAYDVYKTYINPKATGKQLMKVNYISMTAFALFMGGFSTMLYYIGVGMGYLYLLMGVIISSGVAPAAGTLIWKDQVCCSIYVPWSVSMLNCLSIVLGRSDVLSDSRFLLLKGFLARHHLRHSWRNHHRIDRRQHTHARR